VCTGEGGIATHPPSFSLKRSSPTFETTPHITTKTPKLLKKDYYTGGARKFFLVEFDAKWKWEKGGCTSNFWYRWEKEKNGGGEVGRAN